MIGRDEKRRPSVSRCERYGRARLGRCTFDRYAERLSQTEVTGARRTGRSIPRAAQVCMTGLDGLGPAERQLLASVNKSRINLHRRARHQPFAQALRRASGGGEPAAAGVVALRVDGRQCAIVGLRPVAVVHHERAVGSKLEVPSALGAHTLSVDPFTRGDADRARRPRESMTSWWSSNRGTRRVASSTKRQHSPNGTLRQPPRLRDAVPRERFRPLAVGRHSACVLAMTAKQHKQASARLNAVSVGRSDREAVNQEQLFRQLAVQNLRSRQARRPAGPPAAGLGGPRCPAQCQTLSINGVHRICSNRQALSS